MRDNLNNSNTKTQNSKTKELETRYHKVKTPIIVGFDPGLTVGLAILDLNGDLLFLDSFKEITKSEIITIIMKFGRTILVATDVEHSPKAVRKLASSLNAKVFSPKNDIPVSYKNELVSDFLKNSPDLSTSSTFVSSSASSSFSSSSTTKEHSDNHHKYDSNFNQGFIHNHGSANAHERDSLSAAILAYNNYKKKLNQLERKFLEAKMDINSIDKLSIINENYYDILNQAKSFLINNLPISEAISKAFQSWDLLDKENNSDMSISNTNLHSNKNMETYDEQKNDYGEDNLSILEEKFNKLKNIKKSQDKRIKNQDKVIETLKNKNDSLLKELNEKDQKIIKIEKNLKELKLKESKAILKDKEVASKIKLLKKIQLKYKEEKTRRKNLEEKLNKRLKLDDFDSLSIFTPIKIVDSFTKNGLNEVNKLFKLKRGDVIYLSSSKGGGSQTAKFIVNLGVKAIIISKNNETMSPQAEEVFENQELPILKEDDLDIKFFDDYAVADSKVLDEKISKWKNEIKRKSTKKAHDDLLNVIQEYRVGRKREI